MKYYIPTDYVIEINSFRENPISSDFVSSQYKVYSDCSTKSISKNTAKVFDAYVNNIDIDNISETKNHTKALKDVYGKINKFKFVSNMTKSSEEDTVVNLYIPTAINITSPKIERSEELYPHCYFKNFIIRWNADRCNTNGLVVAVEWLGTTVIGEDYQNTYIRRTDYIKEDDGETVLSEKLFDEIPNTALVYITLMRGNIENINIDNYSVKLSGASTCAMPIVLIRKIKAK